MGMVPHPTCTSTTSRRSWKRFLTNSPPPHIGKFGYRDIQIATGDIPPPAAVDGKEVKSPDLALINAAFEDTSTEHLVDTQTDLQGLLDDLAGIDAARFRRKSRPGASAPI